MSYTGFRSSLATEQSDTWFIDVSEHLTVEFHKGDICVRIRSTVGTEEAWLSDLEAHYLKNAIAAALSAKAIWSA